MSMLLLNNLYIMYNLIEKLKILSIIKITINN